jgi:DNA ligase (NAD+)
MELIKKSKKLDQREFELLLDDLCNRYYNNETKDEVIDDKTYDRLLEIYEEKFKVKYGKVGSKPTLTKVKLPYYLGSLDKIKTQKALDLWIKRNEIESEFILTDKIDGVSALYVNGNKLYKRGDGVEGTDISHLIKYFNLPKIDNCAVRGELVIKTKEFAKYKKDLPNSNPRSIVSGLTNSKTLNTEMLKSCSFIAYQYLDDEKTEKKKSEQFEIIEKLGFELPNYIKIDNIDLEVLQDTLQNFKEKCEYDIDGLVITTDTESELLTGKNPKNSIAFKQDGDGVITTVIEVEWNASKNGVLKPRVKIETIEINDVKINYATAHNAKYIYDNGIGKGAEIEVIRSGDVIPYIKKVVNSVEPDLPNEDLNWEWNNTKVDIILKNSEENSDVIKKQITDFFKQLDAKFLGEKTIGKLYDNGFDTLKKLFNITIEELTSIEGIKSKSAEKYQNAILSSIKDVSLGKIMSASQKFGQGFGEKKLMIILDKYPNILELSKKLKREKLISKIQKIKGIKTVADKFVDNLPNFIEFLEEHSEITIEEKTVEIVFEEEVKEKKKEEKKEEKKKTLNEQVIVLTGFRDKELEGKIIKMGGRVVSAISGKTTILVKKTKDADKKPSSKELKAIENGVEVIEYDDFVEKYKL